MSIGNNKEKRRSLIKRLALTVAAATVVAGFGVGAAGGSGAGQYKTEVIHMYCQSEWNASTGATTLYLFAPDTPDYPIGISGNLPYTVADGTGVFTPGGLMLVVCAHRLTTFPSGAAWRHEAAATLLRGGEDFSVVGARLYQGKGYVAVGPGNRTLITAVGKYVRTCGPACNP